MDDQLRTMVDLRQSVQKLRISLGLREGAVERGSDHMEPQQLATIQGWHETFQDLERRMNEQIKEISDQYPILEAMVSVKGVGEIYAARVASLIDIRRCETVSKLWRYAGYGKFTYWQDASGKIVAPTRGWRFTSSSSGKKERVQVDVQPKEGWIAVTINDLPVQGWLLPFNRRLKTACYNISTSFIMSRSPYRELVYEPARVEYATAHPEWTKKHNDMASRRKMMKMWLSHLWLVWRELEGLPVSQPYVIEHMGHEHILTPKDFGWEW